MKFAEAVMQTAAAVRWNFLGFYKNPRIMITFLFSFILCFFLSDRAMMAANHFDASMQALEPFIWTFGDASSILLCSLMLILLFIDLPKLSPFTPYLCFWLPACSVCRKRISVIYGARRRLCLPILK